MSAPAKSRDETPADDAAAERDAPAPPGVDAADEAELEAEAPPLREAVPYPWPELSTRVRWGYPLLGLVLFAAYLATLARGITFSDGGEILSAITTLGVVHPTGYPIYTVLAHFFARLLPSGIMQCVKVEAFNALCGVGACLFTAYTTRLLALDLQGAVAAPDPIDAQPWPRWSDDLDAPPPPPPSFDAKAHLDADLAGLVAGALLGVGPLLWSQIRIPEVYPFHILLVAWAGFAWTRFELSRKNRYVFLAALAMGLGLAHHVTMVYFLPAAFLYLCVRKPYFLFGWAADPLAQLVRRFRPGFLATTRWEPTWGFIVACLIGLAPLFSYAYLVWANAHSTGLPWGDTHDWPTVWAHMTGQQYRRFMGGVDLAGLRARIPQVSAVFDIQYLPIGTALFVAGVSATVKRAWPFALLLLAYILANVAHAVTYSVGDFGTYFLPGIWACAVLIGAGAWWSAQHVRFAEHGRQVWVAVTALAAVLAGAGVLALYYARFLKRVPWFLGTHGGAPLAVPLLVLAVAAAAVAMRLRRERPGDVIGPERAPKLATALPLAVLAIFALAAVSRGHDLAREPLVGESFGAEVAGAVPPGAIYMTQGDGFLFTLWYEAHVLDRGKDFITLDMGNLGTGWYQRYLREHFPTECDPIAPELASSPAAYAAKCGTFRRRMDLASKSPWVKIDLHPFRSGKERAREAPLAETIARGGDARCDQIEFSSAHPEDCKCADVRKTVFGLDEECVPSAEEGGIVPRAPVEAFAQRIIEDHIDERPVFERNTLTNWEGDAKQNARGWSGPSYQRPSADYSLVNRGRANQVVYADDVQGLDPCASATFRPLPLRAPKPRQSRSVIADRRRPYRPNDWPTLIAASYLTLSPSGGDDDATRAFLPGDRVSVHFDWFEKSHWDASKPDKKAGEIRHGLRMCFFDPSGARVAVASGISGGPTPKLALDLPKDAPAGVWHVQACSVGELDRIPDDPSDFELPAGRRCVRPVLEYAFRVGP
jgi:hypothetical protein